MDLLFDDFHRQRSVCFDAPSGVNKRIFQEVKHGVHRIQQGLRNTQRQTPTTTTTAIIIIIILVVIYRRKGNGSEYFTDS
jgi:hypothetical protein